MTGDGITSSVAAAADMPSTSQKVKADDDAEGARAPTEVLTL